VGYHPLSYFADNVGRTFKAGIAKRMEVGTGGDFTLNVDLAFEVTHKDTIDPMVKLHHVKDVPVVKKLSLVTEDSHQCHLKYGGTFYEDTKVCNYYLEVH